MAVFRSGQAFVSRSRRVRTFHAPKVSKGVLRLLLLLCRPRIKRCGSSRGYCYPKSVWGEHFFRAPFLAPSQAEQGKQCSPKKGCFVALGAAGFPLSPQLKEKTTTACTHTPRAASVQVSDKAQVASARTSLPQPIATSLRQIGVHYTEAVRCAGYITVLKHTRKRKSTLSSNIPLSDGTVNRYDRRDVRCSSLTYDNTIPIAASRPSCDASVSCHQWWSAI